jgi:hypothetical protein
MSDEDLIGDLRLKLAKCEAALRAAGDEPNLDNARAIADAYFVTGGLGVNLYADNVQALVNGGVPFLNALEATLKAFDHKPAAAQGEKR